MHLSARTPKYTNEDILLQLELFLLYRLLDFPILILHKQFFKTTEPTENTERRNRILSCRKGLFLGRVVLKRTLCVLCGLCGFKKSVLISCTLACDPANLVFFLRNNKMDRIASGRIRRI